MEKYKMDLNELRRLSGQTQLNEKSMKELIAYHTQQLEKTMKVQGATSDAVVGAFFRLQAAKMGLPDNKIPAYANAESKRLHKQTLDNV